MCSDIKQQNRYYSFYKIAAAKILSYSSLFLFLLLTFVSNQLAYAEDYEIIGTNCNPTTDDCRNKKIDMNGNPLESQRYLKPRGKDNESWTDLLSGSGSGLNFLLMPTNENYVKCKDYSTGKLFNKDDTAMLDESGVQRNFYDENLQYNHSNTDVRFPCSQYQLKFRIPSILGDDKYVPVSGKYKIESAVITFASINVRLEGGEDKFYACAYYSTLGFDTKIKRSSNLSYHKNADPDLPDNCVLIPPFAKRMEVPTWGKLISDVCTDSSFENPNRLAKSPHPFTSIIVQCIEETMFNLFDYKGRGPAGDKSFFVEMQGNLQAFITILLALYVTMTGYKMIITHGNAVNRAESHWFILKIVMVMYFAAGPGVIQFLPAMTEVSQRIPLTMMEAIQKPGEFASAKGRIENAQTDYNAAQSALIAARRNYFENQTDTIAQSYLNTTMTNFNDAKDELEATLTREASYGYDYCNFKEAVYPAYQGRNRDHMKLWDIIDCKIMKYFGVGYNAENAAAPQTVLLALSAIVSLPIGIVIFFLAMTFIIFIVLILLRVTNIFLTSFIGLTVLIYISPLIIPAVLFNFTKDMFEKWFKQVIAYILQPMILFAFLVLTLMLFDKVIYGGNNKFCDAYNGYTEVVEVSDDYQGTLVTCTATLNLPAGSRCAEIPQLSEEYKDAYGQVRDDSSPFCSQGTLKAPYSYVIKKDAEGKCYDKDTIGCIFQNVTYNDDQGFMGIPQLNLTDVQGEILVIAFLKLIFLAFIMHGVMQGTEEISKTLLNAAGGGAAGMAAVGVQDPFTIAKTLGSTMQKVVTSPYRMGKGAYNAYDKATKARDNIKDKYAQGKKDLKALKDDVKASGKKVAEKAGAVAKDAKQKAGAAASATREGIKNAPRKTGQALGSGIRNIKNAPQNLAKKAGEFQAKRDAAGGLANLAGKAAKDKASSAKASLDKNFEKGKDKAKEKLREGADKAEAKMKELADKAGQKALNYANEKYEKLASGAEKLRDKAIDKTYGAMMRAPARLKNAIKNKAKSIERNIDKKLASFDRKVNAAMNVGSNIKQGTKSAARNLKEFVTSREKKEQVAKQVGEFVSKKTKPIRDVASSMNKGRKAASASINRRGKAVSASMKQGVQATIKVVSNPKEAAKNTKQALNARKNKAKQAAITKGSKAKQAIVLKARETKQAASQKGSEVKQSAVKGAKAVVDKAIKVKDSVQKKGVAVAEVAMHPQVKARAVKEKAVIKGKNAKQAYVKSYKNAANNIKKGKASAIKTAKALPSQIKQAPGKMIDSAVKKAQETSQKILKTEAVKSFRAGLREGMQEKDTSKVPTDIQNLQNKPKSLKGVKEAAYKKEREKQFNKALQDWDKKSADNFKKTLPNEAKAMFTKYEKELGPVQAKEAMKKDLKEIQNIEDGGRKLDKEDRELLNDITDMRIADNKNEVTGEDRIAQDELLNNVADRIKEEVENGVPLDVASTKILNELTEKVEENKEGGVDEKAAIKLAMNNMAKDLSKNRGDKS